MTQDQRSFLSKAGLPVTLYCIGLFGVCTISAIWGITAHAFWIDLVALAFTYSLVIAVFLGAVRAANEADDSGTTEARAPVDTTPTLRHAA